MGELQTTCFAGGNFTADTRLHTEPDLVDSGPVGGNPKAGMPTGSHAAAAGRAATSKTPKSVTEGGPQAGMPAADKHAQDSLSGSAPGAAPAAWNVARGQRALDRQLDKEFGIVSTTTGSASHFAGAEQGSTHGARDGVHELVPGDADMVVAPKEAMEEVQGSRPHQGLGSGPPASHEHRTKHHKNKWWAGR